jgi:hypothetical protein
MSISIVIYDVMGKSDVTRLHVMLQYTCVCFDVKVICERFDNKVIFILCQFILSLLVPNANSEFHTTRYLKDGVFCDVTSCGSCNNRRFGGP